jgi:hypothetical protein
MGFESSTVTANVSDAGIYSKFLNCYGNKNMLMAGRGWEISGGYFHRIEAQAASQRGRIANVTIKHWEANFPGAGGYFDNGAATAWRNIYDEVAVAYTYPHKPRVGITVGATPFTWQNTTGGHVEIIMQTGTVSQVRILRGGDGWLNPVAIPGKHLLAPNDSIEVAYSVAPGMSYVPHNSFQG